MKKSLPIIFVLLFVASILNAQTKKVLFEEFTGAHCGNCPMGSYAMDSLLGIYPNVIGVSLHTYGLVDAMFFQEIDTIGTVYAAGAPLGATDRIYQASWGYVAEPSPNWGASIQNRLAVPAQLTVTVNATWNSATRNISTQISTNILANLPSGDYRFNLYVVEDSVTGSSSGYDQSSYYDAVVGNPFYGMGDPIVGYVHRHVVRAILPQAWGQAGIIPSSPTIGQNFNTTFNYTLPLGYNENNIKLVAFVSEFTSNHQGDEVLNVDETSLIISGLTENKNENYFLTYPNPTTGCFTIGSEINNTELVIYNMLGEIVYMERLADKTNVVDISGLENGVYFLALSNGENSSVRKIVLNKNGK